MCGRACSSAGPSAGGGSLLSGRTWHWAFSLFRAADGAVVAVIPLTVAVTYDRSIAWVAGVFALMNIVAVPSGLLWSKVMARGRYRRRIAALGFITAAVALFGMALVPDFPLFVAYALVFTMAGLATAPAAAVLALENVSPDRWGEANGALSRHTGVAYILGLVAAVMVGLTGIAPVQPWVFVGAAVSSALGAAIALRTIPHFEPDRVPIRKYRREAVQKGQRRFERYTWFPSRLRNRPSLRGIPDAMKGPSLSLLLGMYLMFTGTLIVLSSYPGVLADRLGLIPGLVLLGQVPSFLASSFTYAPAGRLGDRIGLAQATRIGVVLRVFVVPAMTLTVLLAGTSGFVAIMLFHGLLGVAFAFLSVNGPCLAAELSPHGRGEAVGWFHAASGLGVMSGALLSAVTIAVFSLEVSYGLATFLVLAGAVLVWLRVPTAGGRSAFGIRDNGAASAVVWAAAESAGCPAPSRARADAGHGERCGAPPESERDQVGRHRARFRIRCQRWLKAISDAKPTGWGGLFTGRLP